MGKQMCY